MLLVRLSADANGEKNDEIGATRHGVITYAIVSPSVLPSECSPLGSSGG